MTSIQKLIAMLVFLVGLSGICYYSGASHVQKKWDIDKAERAAVVAHELELDAKVLADLKDKYKTEVEYAKSKAGRDAITNYIRTHGMLCAESGVHQTNVSGGSDATSGESGTSGRLAEFTARCADDARRVRMCTEWAIREGLPVK